MRKTDPRRHWLKASGAFVGIVALNVACIQMGPPPGATHVDHISQHHAQSRETPSPTHTAPASTPAPLGIAGSWLCVTPGQCPADQVLTIGKDLDSIVTTGTKEISSNPSVCYVQETDDLKISEESDSNTYTGTLTPVSLTLPKDNEDTADCPNVFAQPSSTEPSDITIAHNPKTDQLTIGNISYRRASSADLANVARTHAQIAGNTSVFGTWTCADSDCAFDTIDIEAKTLTHKRFEKIGSLDCYVVDVATLAPGDPTSDPVYAALTTAPIANAPLPAGAPAISQKGCGPAIDQWLSQNKPGQTVHVEFDHDGNRVITYESSGTSHKYYR